MIGLCIGYGIWWSYFDLVGRRLPRAQHRSMALWVYSHLPLTMAVAAAGAAMVSLVAHAGDARAPAPTACLLSGTTATVVIMLIIVVRSLDAYDAEAHVYRPVLVALAAGAVAMLMTAWPDEDASTSSFSRALRYAVDQCAGHERSEMSAANPS